MKPETCKALGLTAVCLATQFPWANAATYYISSSQGSDASSATSSNAPWASLSKASSTHFVAGDSLLLRAGDVFEGPLSLNYGGSSGSRVAIDRYGTGANPIIYGDHSNAVWTSVGGHPGIYSTMLPGNSLVEHVYDINGVAYTLTKQGTNTLDKWLATFVPTNWGGINQTTIYIMTPDRNAPPQMHLLEWATLRMGKSYITVQNMDIYAGSFGIACSAGTGLVLRNNYIHDTFNIGIYLGSWCVNSEVCTNVITRTGETSIYLSKAGNMWVHHNTISYTIGTILGCSLPSKPTPERCGVGLQQGTNNLVEYNSISYMYGSCFDYWAEVGSEVRYNYGFHSTGGAYPTGTALLVHHNIFNLDHAGPGINGGYDYEPTLNPSTNTGPILVYNNVVYNFVNYGLFSGSSSNATIYRNNIIVATTATNALVQYVPQIGSDYNLYWSTPTPKGWFWNNTNNTSFAAFRVTSGQESHGLYADPQFVSANPVVAADFQLKSNSPCINAGQNLKLASLLAPAVQYQDYLGTPIPKGTGPDIGAYEKIPSLGPPSDLHQIK